MQASIPMYLEASLDVTEDLQKAALDFHTGVDPKAKDEDLKMEFENKVLRQYYDWQYFLKRQMEAEKGQE